MGRFLNHDGSHAPKPPFVIDRNSWQARGLVLCAPLFDHAPATYDLVGRGDGHRAWLKVRTEQHGLVVPDVETDLTDGRVFLNGTATLHPDPMSMSCWIVTDRNTNSTPFSKENGAPWMHLAMIAGTGAAKLRCTITTSVGGTKDLDATTSDIVVGQTHLIGMSYKDGTFRGIVDGVEVVTFSKTGTISYTSTERWTLGGQSEAAVPVASPHYNGALWDCRVYDRFLSDEEWLALWNPATRWDLYKPDRGAGVFAVPTAAEAAATVAHYAYPMRVF